MISKVYCVSVLGQQHSNLESAVSDEYMFHTVNFAFETLHLKKFVRLISLISIASITSSFHAMHGYLYNVHVVRSAC